jgi:hypothetical protein
VHVDKNISGYKTNIIHFILHINVVEGGGVLFGIVSTFEGFHQTINISSCL